MQRSRIEEPERESLLNDKKSSLICPFAIDKLGSHRVRGGFDYGYPQGAVIHYTASDVSAESLINYGGSKGYAYWVIGQDGAIYQTHRLDHWGYHAGKSYWADLGSSVSQYLLGIEIMSAGKLNKDKDGKFLTWYGKIISKKEVRASLKRDNIAGGYYHKATDAQERSLLSLLFWLRQNGGGRFSFNYVLGHDEVSKGRKTDPGAVIPWSMPELRKLLISSEVQV